MLETLKLHLGLGFLGLICLSWLPFAVVLHPLLPVRQGRALGRRFIMHAFRLYLRWLELLGACRFDITELDRLRDAGPLILAPNHPCLLDAVMVISRLPDVACIMKASLMDNLFLGAGARLARYIPNDSPVGMIMRAATDLSTGSQLLLFPEGTRTEHRPMNRVKPSVALIALRAQVPVQAIIIETDSAYLGKGWPLFRRPAMPIHYRIRLGKRFDPPAETAGFTAELERHFKEELARSTLVPPPCPFAADAQAA
ncbi:MAG: 1-acyl-sn-glycerol-3-phosphate acyltransferase [Zoogloea sp.]|nr:1-acyl-sn-glycerol-3-phosphate acyltransferase [Zoogloea sp.]